MPALAAAVGLLASLVLVAWLRSHRYRYADEVDLPHRRHVWVLLTLPLAAAAVAYQLKDLPQLVAVLYGLTLIPLTALTAIDLDV